MLMNLWVNFCLSLFIFISLKSQLKICFFYEANSPSSWKKLLCHKLKFRCWECGNSYFSFLILNRFSIDCKHRLPIHKCNLVTSLIYLIVQLTVWWRRCRKSMVVRGEERERRWWKKGLLKNQLRSGTLPRCSWEY